MRAEERAPERADEKTLRHQREANEKLVVAALQAQEDAEEAVSARHRAEQDAGELRAREEALRQTAEFRERLLGIVGHDLRDPLNMIVMAAGLLIAHGNLTEEDRRLVDRLVQTGERMGRMIGQLVEFTRAGLGGGFDLVRTQCDLGDLCHDIAEELRIASRVRVIEAIEGDLRGAWDADRLVEAISNVAGNASEHAAAGTAVVIRARAAGDMCIVEVVNEGACIPPELLPVIFKAFRGTETGTPSKKRHLGLGLYIACEIVRAHGGSIHVESAAGKTMFAIRVPRLVAPALVQSAPSSALT